MSSVGLASRLAGLEESATLALNARAGQLASTGRTIYNLTAGELATSTPEYIQTTVASKLAENKYTSAAGLPELREAIAAHARDFYGLVWIRAHNVVVTAGAKPALFAGFLSLLNPRDEVILPVPGWTVSYKPLVELAGGKVVEVPLSDDFDLDATAVMAKVSARTKAVILNSPNNPTGGVYSVAQLKKLAAGISGKNITVIADDIYSRLVYDSDFKAVPSCGFENLLIINGFSKSQALTGWRIGYLIADDGVASAAAKILSHITGNAPLPGQYAAVAALQRGDIPPDSTLSDLKARRRLVAVGLTTAGLKYNLPAGAFYFFLNVRGLAGSSAKWCERLLNEAGVALIPGEAFSAPGFARLTFVADESALRPALAAINKFVKKETA